MLSRLSAGRPLDLDISVELIPTVKKEIYSADPGKDRPYFSGLMILLFSGNRVFLTQPKFNIHRLLQFVSFPGLRADVCSDVIGDEHGQGVVGYFPFAVDQLDNASPSAMS